MIPETADPTEESSMGLGESLKSNKGEIVGLALGSSCGLLVLLALVYLAYRVYLRRRGDPEDSECEKILASRPSIASTQPRLSIASSTDSKSACAPLSMRTIPFTVPSTGPPSTRRSDSRLLSETDATSTGSGSEPNSPSLPPTRGSQDSLNSTSAEFRGAYALGSIDPSLYRMVDEDDDYEFPDNHIGRIWFAVEYERESEKLLVTLMKAKNLPSRSSGASNGCDPFVRIYLMPDERRYLQSKFKKKTCSPKFEESFVFQVSNKSIQERVLKLTVYDVDRHRRHNVIGHALFPLREHDYETNERVVIWRDLEREVAETTLDRGELHVSLSYNHHLERITVGVFEGRNFKVTEGNNLADFYSKVCLMQQGKIVKSRKTDVIKRTSQPSFNESFTFKLPVSALDTTSVSVNVYQHHTSQKDKMVGRLVVGSFMFARGKELEHWNEMLANQKEQVSHWHTLT